MKLAKRLLLALPIPVILVVFIVVTGGMSECVASCDGYKSELITTVEACPTARTALGDKVHFKKLSYACGSSETSGGTGRASWDVAVYGSKTDGRLTYDAEKHGGQWVFTSMNLEVGDAVIDILACARSAKDDASVKTASWNGSVLRSTHDKVGDGASCAGRLDVIRRRVDGLTGDRAAAGNVESDPDGSRAHLLVHCAGMVVYDADGDFEGSPATQTLTFSGKGIKLQLKDGHGTGEIFDGPSTITIAVQ